MLSFQLGLYVFFGGLTVPKKPERANPALFSSHESCIAKLQLLHAPRGICQKIRCQIPLFSTFDPWQTQSSTGFKEGALAASSAFFQHPWPSIAILGAI